MRERVELLVNLWTFGVPVVLMVWALLRLAVHAPARTRYLITVIGFAATLSLPLLAPRFTRGAPATEGAPQLAVAVADRSAAPLTMTWFAVAALLLLRDGVGHARLRRIRRALGNASDALANRLDWPRRVPLLVSSHPAPFTVGMLRPAVVLPADLSRRFSTDVAQRIARHELSHARWRDPLVYALLRAAAAVFWVAPAWIVLRWVRREREAAADASALRDACGDEESYVAALLRLAPLRETRELAPAMAGSDLEYRARRILAPQRMSIAALLVLGAGAFLLSAARPAQLDAAEPVILRPRSVIVEIPERVVKVNVVPSKKPRRLRLNPTPRKIENIIEQRIEQDNESLDVEVLPVSRSLSALIPAEAPSPPPAVETAYAVETTHVDVHRRVNVARHVTDEDRRRIRIVIRN